MTGLISKDTFKVVDNLSGTMMRCRVNQNLFDFFTGKVICMHASLVFLFLALGFIQLLIFLFFFFSGCYNINASTGKDICYFPNTASQFIKKVTGSCVLVMTALIPADRMPYKQQVRYSQLVPWSITAVSFSSSLQLALVFKS